MTCYKHVYSVPPSTIYSKLSKALLSSATDTDQNVSIGVSIDTIDGPVKSCT